MQGGAEGLQGGAEGSSPSPVRVQGHADLWGSPLLVPSRLPSRLKLCVPDIFLSDLKGSVVFVLEIKMHGGDSVREAAEDQLKTCVYGNWRNGMKAMGGRHAWVDL